VSYNKGTPKRQVQSELTRQHPNKTAHHAQQFNAAPVTARLYPSPSVGRSGMEACATGLGLDKESSAAARAPDDRRVTAASCLDPHTPPNHPL